MKRRTFIIRGAALSAGCVAIGNIPAWGTDSLLADNASHNVNLSNAFRNPESKYHPFVRWWWNGDKVQKEEIIRELHLLKEAGIGGVEINPIAFPSSGDDLGIKSLTWLSNEWMDMLQVAFDEAKKLDMVCDLIVGSGWPFGAESLPRNERAQVAIIYAETLEGPTTFETSQFNIFDTVDPGVTDPCPSRTFEILSLKLVPEPMSSLNQVIDLSEMRNEKVIKVDIPQGKYVFYALVKVDSFANVINGAPGAAGPILNHMDSNAVRKYLNHMSDTIQKRTGPLSDHLRALFSDSMELEGCNWNEDLPDEFKKRRGYDLMPYLPFTMFKVGRLGAVIDPNYGVTKAGDFAEEIKRVRFDFELTKAELLYERFTKTYLQWCKDLNVKSRAQAYGRGFFPLESSLGYDIPEGESWTTNWLKHRVGEEMSDEDYRRGRGYTMINKYVSSAAHLTGKRVVSCEEMTNTYNVFNITLEQLKIGSDMSIMSGITHSVWHGFNYSPAEAPFPGWVQYGSYYSEKNNWWPYFKYLNEYKARLSSLLQNSDMYTDMAILPANYDMWGEMGVQTDPFPERLNISYTSIIWESINKNGGAADYTTEIIINDSRVKNGKLCYGPKEYGTLFLPEVTSIGISTLQKLHDFVATGGRIFCIEKYPEKSLGLKNWKQRDEQVAELVEKMKKFKDRFILISKPEDNRFLEWYKSLMKEYNLPHYLTIEKPNRFFMQTRHKADDGSEMFFFQNVHKHDSYKTRVSFPKSLARSRYPWVWDPETGNSFRIYLSENSFEIDLGPAETRVIVFSKEKNGAEWKPLPVSGGNVETINNDWEVELRHSRENSIQTFKMFELQDLKETDYVNFTGTAVYRKSINFNKESSNYLNLGKVWGVSELFVNGKSCGVKWYGNRIYNLSGILREGENEIEVHVITSMGNYVKTLTENRTAQRFTMLRTKNQPIQSMGILGPVTIY
ncbi:alpha-L-rhamnosidase [Mariniphaga anaerophila]|uniref:Alpha-L-rhamnosidase n=1 Tax=Mariniphaga anaerophila TaxID=1484053 RepID=A0A1M5G1C1_9BACT|nr:glycosyl hydrolase [Mariniphaga anaerophila]SHF97617.1 alpha-L-rhamnosidase [Mariniphaga anaerophila]